MIQMLTGLDWEALRTKEDEWEIWTPNATGGSGGRCCACIGKGKTIQAAIDDMKMTLLRTVRDAGGVA